MDVFEIDKKEILDCLPNPVFLRDEDGNFIYANKRFYEAFQLKFDAEQGFSALSNIDFFRQCDLGEKLRNGGQNGTCVPFQLDDGSNRWIQISASKFQLNNGKTAHLGVISDVTERIETQKNLETTKMFETSVNHVTQSVIGSFDEDEIIRTFVSGTFEEFRLEDCVVYLTDENGDLFRVAALSKMETEVQTDSYRVARDKGVVGRASRTRKTQLVNDTRKDPDYFSEETFGLSELAVPIIHQGDLLGVLDSEHSELGFFTEDYRRTFETCASLLAMKLVEARTLRELQEQKSMLYQILESPKDIHFFSIDKNFCYKYFNSKHRESMKELWGSSIKVGDCILDKIANEADKELAKKHFQKAFNGEDFVLTQSYGSKNRYWEDIFTPHFSTDGTIEGASVFTREVSDIIADRQKLQESEKLLASIHENIPSGLFRTTIDEKITYVNSSMLGLFGYNEEEIKSLRMQDLFVDDFAYNKWIEVLEKKQSSHGFEAMLKRKSGESFMALINSSCWTNPEGIVQLDGAISDLSELHHAKIELESNNHQLQKINAELDHIVYRTSHDMRSPVASMLGLMELIEIPEGTENAQYLSMLHKQILRLDGIIYDIVNYRKIGTISITPEPLDIETLIKTVLQDLAYMDDCKNIKKSLDVNNPYNLPFISDRFNLEIILNNLVSNAIKYSDGKKPQQVIGIRVNIDRDFMTLEIEDNGIGISEEYHDKIFDMFFRATNSKNGTGLGLFILKEAIAKLKGRIWFSSQIGDGTTFSVRVPRVANKHEKRSKKKAVVIEELVPVQLN